MAEPHQTHAQRFFQLLLLATSTWSVIYARFALGAMQETMRVDLALSDNQIAWLQGPAVAVPMALGAIPAGLIVDRYPRAPLFVFFIALNLAATVLTAFATSLPLLFAARILVGLALSVILVAAYSMVADLYAPAQRGRATMVVTMGEICGAPSAFAVGGVLLAMSGSMVSFGLEGWRWVLLWMCAPLLPIVILMLVLREPPRTGMVVKNPSLSEVWLELWRYRGVVVTLLAARMMVWIGDGAVVVWAAPSFERSFGLPPERTGALMATVLLVSGILGPVLGGPLADLCQRKGGSRLTVTALCIVTLLSAPAALFAIMPDATIASIVLTAFLTCGFTIGVAAMSLATILVPGELRGLYLALTFTVGALFCFGIAPLVVSGLSVALGGPAMIGKALAIVCGVTSVLGAIVFGFGRRYFPDATGERSVSGAGFVAGQAYVGGRDA